MRFNSKTDPFHSESDSSYSVGPHGSLVFVVQGSPQLQLLGQPEVQETLYMWRQWYSNHRGDILPYSEQLLNFSHLQTGFG